MTGSNDVSDRATVLRPADVRSWMASTNRAVRRIGIEYGCYQIEDDGLPMHGEPPYNALLNAGVTDEGGATVFTGTFWGPIEVAVEILDAPPPPIVAGPGEPWELSEQLTLTAEGDVISVESGDGSVASFPQLQVAPGGTYSVRVSAHGVAAGTQRPQYDDGSEPCELHLVQLWAIDAPVTDG